MTTPPLLIKKCSAVYIVYTINKFRKWDQERYGVIKKCKVIMTWEESSHYISPKNGATVRTYKSFSRFVLSVLHVSLTNVFSIGLFGINFAFEIMEHVVY